jgi:hypothetical protein
MGRVLPGAQVRKADFPAWAMAGAQERTRPASAWGGERSSTPGPKADLATCARVSALEAPVEDGGASGGRNPVYNPEGGVFLARLLRERRNHFKIIVIN